MRVAGREGWFERGDRARIVRRAWERAWRPMIGAVGEGAKEEGRENDGREKWKGRCAHLRLG